MSAAIVPGRAVVAATPTSIPPPELRLRHGDWSKVRRVEWLWESRIPIGKLSLLVGEEGAGKGTLLVWLVVQAITGQLPGDRSGRPVPVLIVGDEDGFEDTWMPRLRIAGATAEQVNKHVWTLDPDEALNYEADGEKLSRALQHQGIGWVIFDQLLDHMDGGRDGAGVYNPKRVRQALKPLRDVARRANVAVTGSLHPVKGTPRTFRELIGGSHQFNAVSRSSLWIGRDPDGDDADRVLVRGKGNLSAEPPAFEFRIATGNAVIDEVAHEQPVVTNPREGMRYRRDFESNRGFGVGPTVPAHVQYAEAIVALLHSETPQTVAELVKRAEAEGLVTAQGKAHTRNTVGPSLDELAKQGRARKADPENKQSGWLLATNDSPSLD